MTHFSSLLFILIFFFSANVQGNALDKLTEQLKKYESLSGRFQQTLVDDQGLLIQESSGDFTLKKPGYFRWNTVNPFPQLLISNLETIWLYDPDLEQVTIRRYENMVDQTPNLLLSGDSGRIAENYQVEFADGSSETDLHFMLTPKFDGSSFTQLQLVFQEDTLSAMILTDSLQQTTTFRFFEITLNPPVNMDEFEFTPPQGVDVLIDN